MFEFTLAQIVFLSVILVFTAAAAVSDLRTRKIPNWMTAPMCLAGLAWQVGFHGWAGLQAGLLGFLVGFGIMFILWMVGSAGGGDVKLLGGLSTWLGWWLTLRVLIFSLVFVVLGTFGVLLMSLMNRGWRGTRSKFLPEGRGGKGKNAESSEGKKKRRVMAFAGPVALATWSALLLYRNQW